MIDQYKYHHEFLPDPIKHRLTDLGETLGNKPVFWVKINQKVLDILYNLVDPDFLMTIGFLSGLLGGIAASATTWALGYYILEIEFYSFGTAILLGVALGLSVSLLAGLRLQQKIQTASTMECLREA